MKFTAVYKLNIEDITPKSIEIEAADLNTARDGFNQWRVRQQKLLKCRIDTINIFPSITQ